MRNLNREQEIARSLESVNYFIGLLAIIPALLCWLLTIEVFKENRTNEILELLFSSLLLIVFYTYTLFPLRIYNHKYYNEYSALYFWLAVLITNGLTTLLFISCEVAIVSILPGIPMIYALRGLIAHYKINQPNQ